VHDATPEKEVDGGVCCSFRDAHSRRSFVAAQGFHELEKAAAYFGVSAWSIRGLIAKGFVKAKRIGKYDVVRRADHWRKAAA